MRYVSTRNKNIRYSAAQTITMGLAEDGGLFVPEVLPQFSLKQFADLCDMKYGQKAVYIMNQFLSGFTYGEINSFVDKAYTNGKFDTPEIAPLYNLDKNTYFLELWHGPTCAFKDVALQILPYFLTTALKKQEIRKQVCILTATSGDTGKAALEGFKDVPNTKIMVFYPRDGVSEMQKRQMMTQEGKNVSVCSVLGNFDDAQTGVKKIFADDEMKKAANERKYIFSSANSINWGRLLPQVVYYVSSYCNLVKDKKIRMGEEINFCVPTGNFGDILAGYYAKSIGLPIKKLICASNINNVLTDFIKTGIYDKNRPFHTTISPSMDILISSNLERLVFELSGKDDALIREYMNSLSTSGRYEVSDKIKAAVSELFWAGYCDDAKTKMAIDAMFRKNNYLIDPHTAVGYDVLTQYRAATNDSTLTVVLSTANPYKFSSDVISALGYNSTLSGFEVISRLESITETKAPRPIMMLKNKGMRFNGCVAPENMSDAVLKFLDE